MKKNNKKTFTRKKSPEQQEAELIREQLEKERMVHALEMDIVPLRLSAKLNDSGDYIHITTTNKTKYFICTVEVDSFEIFKMIDDDIQNLLKQAKECYTDFVRLQIKYGDRSLNIINKKNIPDEDCFSLDEASDYLSLQEFFDELDDDLDDDYED